MKAVWEIFRLEILGLIRSHAVTMLTVVSFIWMLAAPFVFHSDGTDEGAREMCVRFSLGGVSALLAVALLVAAAGSLSRERAAKRLQLTMVRPVRLWGLVIGKTAAISAVGALVLAMAAGVELLRQDASRACSSVFRPVLPSPSEEAAAMYASYMADPETPPEVKKAKKSVVMRLLTQKAIDHYQTIGTNETVTWEFPANALEPLYPVRSSTCLVRKPACAVRFRFTNMYEMRDEVKGIVRIGGMDGVVSNITQAIVTVPLATSTSLSDLNLVNSSQLSFVNEGSRTVMLRPRKDVELLVEADGFYANLLRAYLQLVAMLTLLTAFGVFLGAGLSRPVAVFVAVVTLALCEMSPSVVEQYPDQLETSRSDAIGLALARFTATVTRPIGSLTPLSSLAADERVEPDEVIRALLVDVILLPLLLALLSAFVLPRKQDEL